MEKSATKTPTAAKKSKPTSDKKIKPATDKKAKPAAPSDRRKLRIGVSIVVEILVLAATLINTSFAELPYRLILPFVLGLWTIIVKYRSNPALLRVAIVESVFMSLNIAANLLPLYWRLGAFFLLGVRSIFIRHFHRHADGKKCYCDNPDPKTIKNKEN